MFVRSQIGEKPKRIQKPYSLSEAQALLTVILGMSPLMFYFVYIIGVNFLQRFWEGMLNARAEGNLTAYVLLFFLPLAGGLANLLLTQQERRRLTILSAMSQIVMGAIVFVITNELFNFALAVEDPERIKIRILSWLLFGFGVPIARLVIRL